jgi:Na+-transporting methylmalonyl-CoA/oxaloacetate decarboxylase gamma subunit
MPNPTPQQFLIRRIVAVFILLILLIAVFKIASAAVGFVSGIFSSSPQTAPTVIETQNNNSKNLQKCNDADIAVSIGFEGKTNFTSEEVIVIDATFTSIANSNCLRDVGARANEIYVVNANNKKVWSSDTCPVNNKSNLVKMKPGNVYRTTVTWAGNSNPKQCGKEAKHLPAGEYGIYASNGSSISEKATITFE